MSTQARPRYEVVLHQRLLSRSRAPRVIQDLRIPIEVVNAVAGHFDEYDNEVMLMRDFGGDVKATWEVKRPDYNKLAVDYPGTYRIGRLVHPSTSISRIMSWRSEIRNAVLAYGYDQYDISHALPSVIFHYFKDLELPNLDSAIKDLERVGGRPMKDVVTRTLQGCAIPNTPPHLDIMQCEWYDGLVEEAAKIKVAMQVRYRGFVELCKAKRRRDGEPEADWLSTAIQIFYNDIESTLQVKSMEALGEHCDKSTIILNCDALFVPKLVQVDVLELLNELHSAIGIKYTLKPMMQHVNVPDIDLALERVFGGQAQDAVQGAYQVWKQRFEESNFYLAEKDLFVTINHADKKLYFTGYNAMVDSRYAFDKDNVFNWIKDPDRLTYNHIVNVPPPAICRTTDFNLWNFGSGFRAADLPELGPDDDVEELVAPVLECFKCIVSGNEEHYTYLMNYLADTLQNPGIKRAQYIGIFGEQGVGKNELMERFWMDKIIGPNLSAVYGTVGEWAGPFEDGWQPKMCVMVHEAEYKDFSTHYNFLKKVTGSLYQSSNTKYGAKLSIAFYGRIIMLSNYANAFNEDNLISRRQGLRCIASSFRSVPNALEILGREKVQRAFYDYLMDMDLEGWDPETNRVDSKALHDANFMTTFRREPGNMMAILLYMTLDKLYEMFRKVDDNADPPEYKRKFTFPQTFLLVAYYDLCGFETDGKRGKNAHVVSMVTLASKLCPGNPQGLMSQKVDRYYQYKKGDKVLQRPGFRVDYYALKTAVDDFMAKCEIEKFVDIQSETEIALSKIEAYHEELLEKMGWEYTPEKVRFLEVPKTKSAHRNRPGESPAYLVRQGAEVIFRSDDLEEINKELGEAWVEECETGAQVLHINNTEINIGDRYMRENGKTMLELRFPAYIRDRTA